MSEYQKTIDEINSIGENIKEKDEDGKAHDGGEDKPKRRRQGFQKGHKINLGIKRTEKFKKLKRQQMIGNLYRKGKKFPNTKRDLYMEKNPNWKGGRYKTQDGYILIKTSNIKLGGKAYTLEHRLIIEKILNRKIKHPEVVHHINGNRADNRIENLILFKSNNAHKKFEMIIEGIKEGDIIFDGRNYNKGEENV